MAAAVTLFGTRAVFSHQTKQQLVDFEAGRVDVAPKEECVWLSNGFVVRASRYRLWGEKVVLAKTPGGVVVEGEGRLALCSCESPPVSLGFSSALLAPPTDLILRNAVVSVGGVPVFYMPYFWLRSPARPGLVAPSFEYRSEEGLLGSTGVHLPFGDQPSAWDYPKNSLDLRVGGYSRGGLRFQSTVWTERSVTDLEFDHYRSWVYDVDARGSQASGAESVAWDVRLRSGDRARVSALSLEEAVVPVDRGSVSGHRVQNNLSAEVGVKVAAQRGAHLDEVFGGPAFSYQWRGSPGMWSLAAGGSALALAQGPETAWSHARQVARAERIWFLGPLVVDTGVGEVLELASVPQGVRLKSGERAALLLSLPLGREFGDRRDPLRHWVEPGFRVLVAHGRSFESRSSEPNDSVPPTLPWLPPQDPEWAGQALAALETSFGRWGSRQALELGLASGWAWQRQEGEDGGLTSVIGAKADVESSWIRFAGELARESRVSQVLVGATLGGIGTPRAQTGLAARWGEVVKGRSDESGGPRKWLDTRHAFIEHEAAALGWLNTAGTSGWAGLDLPLTNALALAASADADLRSRKVLAVRSSVAYAHPCACLALAGGVASRVARSGIDAWATVDLVP